jgi:hypothetical protein
MTKGFVSFIVSWQRVDGEVAEPTPSTADVILGQSNYFAIFIVWFEWIMI